MGPDPEFEDILAALSSTDLGAAEVSRRRFLQGMVATGGAAALSVGPLGRAARAATALTATDGILVVIMMGGGNDGLNTVIPYTDARYRALRPSLGIPSAQVLPLGTGTGLGLHPALPRLKARFDAGKVAVVRGVGNPDGDHSHFSSMASWMAGTAGSARTSGWLGRWVDRLPDGDDGFRAVAVGGSVPLHLVGTRAQVTTLPVAGAPFGGNRSNAWDARLYDAVAAYGASTTGRGRWADTMAAADRAAMQRAGTVSPLYPDSYTLPAGDLAPQLDLAARLVNLNLGVRVITVGYGSFDTHDDELAPHAALLADLDAGIERFYAKLGAQWADQVTLMTFSEFGRRAEQNDSRGTDHGTAAPMFVIGDQVKGGLFGTQPGLSDLDSRGDLKVKVDFRSVYRSVLSGWLGADAATASAILGAEYADLGLFAATPGGTVGPPPPPPDPKWKPFGSAEQLVQQQYLDFLGRTADAGGTAYWAGRLISGTPVATCIQSFLNSAEFGRAVAPAARISLCGNWTPTVGDLTTWAAMVRSGDPQGRRRVAIGVTSRPGWGDRYHAMSVDQKVVAFWRDAMGGSVPSAFRATWVAALTSGAKQDADLLLAVAEGADYTKRSKARVDVLMVYFGMLRRIPEPSGFDYWAKKVAAGTSIGTLITSFFKSAEYTRRFT